MVQLSLVFINLKCTKTKLKKNKLHIALFLLIFPFYVMGQISTKSLILAAEVSTSQALNPWLQKNIFLNQDPKSNSYVLIVRQHYIPKHKEGFFCRAEDKANRKFAMPIRFRLGNLDYVNRLEGKYLKN